LPGQSLCISITLPSSCNCSVYSSAAMKTLFLFFCSGLSLLIPTTRGVPITGGLPTVRGADCDRPCYEADSFHCIFNWRIVNQFLDCSGETDDCYGDGTPRQATLVSDAEYNNFSIPGPAITVCHGDEVSVNVVNNLESDATTIHWHGLPMRNTQVSDGGPGVTQCPIQPGQEFSWYNFHADTPGTYWYHSHNEFQRDDGMYGPVIIRDPQAAGSCEHTIMIQEWYYNTAQHRFTHDKEEKPTSLLVNGVGRQSGAITSWQVFSVHPAICSSYRFRLVSSVSLHCPVIFSIEEHSFTVIATDGEYLVPEEKVSSLTLANGERSDILIDVSRHKERSYVMRFGGSPGEFANCKDLSALAFLQYSQSPVDQSLEPDYDECISVPGRHVNPVPTVELPVTVTQLHSRYTLDQTQPADKTFYLLFGDGERGAHVNNIQFDLNTLTTPLLTAEEPDSARLCDELYAREGLLCDPNTDKHGCACHNILHVNTGDVVEMFLINPDLERPIAHPFHLHGYFFNVIGSGSIPQEDPMTYVRQLNEEGRIERNLEDPPRKDSIQTSPGGYLLIRFYADNPGYWLMHCHISFDVIEGQAMVLRVGDRDEWDIPQGFPECGK